MKDNEETPFGATFGDMKDYPLKRIDTRESKPTIDADEMLFEALRKQKWQSHLNTPESRLKVLEIASKLKTENGEPMTLKELCGKAEELLNFINQK